LLVDTDVLIWFTRGHLRAMERLQSIAPWQISTVTYIELIQGCRNANEMRTIQRGLQHDTVNMLPITERISERATSLIETYARSHAMRLGDALIAATALEHSLPLCSANRKHFAPIEGLHLEVFVP
jgi:predicted nucleic acid-binding protein